MTKGETLNFKTSNFELHDFELHDFEFWNIDFWNCKLCTSKVWTLKLQNLKLQKLELRNFETLKFWTVNFETSNFASCFSEAHYTWIHQRKHNSDFQVALTVAESNICLKCQKNLLGLCRPYRLIWSFSLGSLDSTIRRPRWYDRTPPPPDLLCPLALLLK